MSDYFVDKTVLLGVCGSVAAYKACELASKLTERGAETLVAMTRSARELIQPATFEAITGRPVITDMFAPITNPGIEHIAVARRANLFLVAPATANILAKAANGIADDWLSTTLLATRAPLVFAPAMNTLMFTHPATEANIHTLRARGAVFVGPGTGKLACGSEGVGRLADIEDILDAVAVTIHPTKDYAGKRVLITSGPNHEPIDPVRYIGNLSSGKMGRALAMEALRRGARVCVITGPAETPPPETAEIVRVHTASEMHRETLARMTDADIIIAAAAVADYRVDSPSPQKIKRSGAVHTLELTPNPDIIASVSSARRPGQLVVGFAAESEDAENNARTKLERKHLDMIVANLVGGDRCALGAELGDAWILSPDKRTETLVRVKKSALARRIFDRLLESA